MSYKSIIYMTLPTECSICYEAFIMPNSIEESISYYKREVLDKANDYMKTNKILQTSKRKRLVNHLFCRKYYQKLWYPHYKQYKCSTENCNIAICGECISELENKSNSIVFQCTHCRLYDWKNYMSKYVFPEMIMICLSQTTGNGIFSMRDIAITGFI